MPMGNLGCCFWIIHNSYEAVPFHFECNISAGFRWLLAEISKDHANLSRRVEKDTAEQVNTLYRGFYKSRQPAKFAIYIKQIDLNLPPTFSENCPC